MGYRCPGTDGRNVKVEDHNCPSCGYTVEIFSDELRAVCPRCGTMVRRGKLPSCVDWCESARQCIGEDAWEELQKDVTHHGKRDNVKEKALLAMRTYFGNDGRRIFHAEKVLRYAETLLEQEPGDNRIVTLAAIFHDIGIREAEKKFDSADGQLQEQEGPPVARSLMEEMGIKTEIIEPVCRIIASHHSPGEVDTPEFNILWDADWLVNIREEELDKNPDVLEKRLEKIFKTPTGLALAKKTFSGGTS